MSNLKELDPLLHQQLRLAIVSLLMGLDSANFVFLREQTMATAGNLSVQIEKLREAGYISVSKDFVDKRPQTTCAITEMGRQAFLNYVKALQTYITIQP
jgi:DNA-binding MarR family transcriptional regulator